LAKAPCTQPCCCLSDSIHMWLIHFYWFNHSYAIHCDSFCSLFDIIQPFQFFFIHSIQ
jgi:hypothetical protein